MPTPHYVATRVGDQFVLVPANAAGAAGSIARPELLAGVALLTLFAALFRGLTRWAMLGLGGALFAAWYGYHNAATRQRQGGGRGTSAITHGPSFPRDQSNSGVRTARANQPPQDAVDEASMESFPASDPPAHTTPSRAV